MDRLSDLAPYQSRFGRQVGEVLRDLEILESMVRDWQRVQNLVSRETLDQIWHRHIIDSLQILPLLSDIPTPRMCDIGSGGGFPALPLAIALQGTGAQLHLIESNARKCAFLGAVGRELDLPIHVHRARIEAVDPMKLRDVDIFTSRALAPLPLLFNYLHALWSEKARAILHKGREYGEELRQTDSVWDFTVLEHKSVTDEGGVLLEISGLTHKST